MIVLLSIGEALLTQARDEKLVGGGDVTVSARGHRRRSAEDRRARRNVLLDRPRALRLSAAARRAATCAVRAAVAPQIEGKLLYARTLSGREWPVMASGEIPSATAAVGAMPPIASGEWADDGLDRAWRDPQPNELRHAIDHFHLPPAGARRDPTWAEWHYFNVLSPDRIDVGVRLVHRRRGRCPTGSGAVRCS